MCIARQVLGGGRTKLDGQRGGQRGLGDGCTTSEGVSFDEAHQVSFDDKPEQGKQGKHSTIRLSAEALTKASRRSVA